MSLWRSLSEKLKNAGNKWTQSVSNLFSDEPLTDEFWDELEELLILGDVGIETTETLIEKLRKTSIDKRIARTSELKKAFMELLVEQLEAVPGMGCPLQLTTKPAVVIMIGVNGSGKTWKGTRIDMFSRSEDVAETVALLTTNSEKDKHGLNEPTNHYITEEREAM